LDYRWIETDNELETKLMVHDQVIMTISEKYYRPAEVDLLYGDSTETRKVLNWKPKVNFSELVKKMVLHDMSLNIC
jgi:GDPmannose 4,6-dehydratase